jgi:2-polyprenyl-3-methyl-5-hydroxy-6-metoxy-1,4-benzoquinol methylase
MSIQNAGNTDWLDRVRANWNERAPSWDAMSEENAVAPERPADLKRTAEALRLTEGARLLDAGCGSGQYAVAFAERGFRVTAVDLSPEMIARARGHADEHEVEVDWRIGEVARLEDADATYDAIHARVVLQFVPDVVAALREFRRVLKPGGRLYASVPGSLSPIYNLSWRRFVDPQLIGNRYLVPWELEALLNEFGWTVLDGWGSFGRNLMGDVNPLDQAELQQLDRRLQQAAATTWAIIAD